jgi:alanine dehydrogenase
MALILRERHVRSLLSMPDTLMVLEKAFNAQVQGAVINMPRNRLILPNGVLHILAAAAPTFGVLGHKTYTAFREGVRFAIILYSAQDGQLLAIIEAEWLGTMRTGGTSALATKYMARPDATTVGLIGSGKQAVTQLMGVCQVRPISSVSVYSRNMQKCEVFCQEMRRLLNIAVQPVNSAREAVESADIVITATTAGEPVIKGEWLPPGCHINAIGSNWAEKRELDSLTLQRCSLIATDSVEQAQEEAGDLIIPVGEGLLNWRNIYELAEIINSTGLARESREEITLYKGLGIALEDIATAAHVYHLACQRGIGDKIQLLS